MVAITATSSATPSLQASLSQTRLQQARGEAARAESVAQNLRTQANNAESEAQRSQGRVRALASNRVSADPTYQPQRSGGNNTQRAFSPFYALQNTQDRDIGRIINLRA